MKTLLFCPTYRLEPETVESIFALKSNGPIDILFTKDNPHKQGREDVLHNYQKGRQAMLDGSYDAMLTVESDIIVPNYALVRLAEHDADVARGLYLYRHGSSVVNALRIEGRKNLGQSFSIFPEEYRAAAQQGVVETSGASFGCTLIHRHVLEDLEFWNDDGGHCDWSFARDCLQEGYKQVVDFGVKCGHKRPDGTIIWPKDNSGIEKTTGQPSIYTWC